MKGKHAKAPPTALARLPALLQNPWLQAGVLIALILLAYSRSWSFGFIWDDDSYVTRNPLLRDLAGLAAIWSKPAASPQYYPLVHSSFWLEYHLWGLNPAGFHIVNVCLHAIASILLWRILIVLRIPGAWLGAAFFALHPVQAESVAWITERKNVLCAVFYFGAALCFLHWRRIDEPRDGNSRGGAGLYLLSLFLFVAALLSKTVACTLPVSLFILIWYRTGHVRKKDLLALSPFVFIGAGLGLFTAWLERHHVLAQGNEWALGFGERFVVAGRAFWFYLFKLAWPNKLTFIYPRWELRDASLVWWLFPLGALALFIALWFGRKKLDASWITSGALFVVALFPALGFFNVYPFRYSFVADHFQYLASAAVLALAGALLARLHVVFGTVLVLVLTGLTFAQTRIYTDLETLWRDTAQKNPDSWMPQNSLGSALVNKGNFEEGIPHLQRALELQPNVAETQSGYGYALLEQGKAGESLVYLTKAKELAPHNASTHFQLGRALLTKGRTAEAIAELQDTIGRDPSYQPAYSLLGFGLLQTGRAEDSLAPLQQAIELEPSSAPAHFNLANSYLQLGRTRDGLRELQFVLENNPNDTEAQKNMAWILATSPDAAVRDKTRAVALAQRASVASGGRDPVVQATLAAAYAEAGSYAEATSTAEGALKLASTTGPSALTALIEKELDLFRAGQPFRDER